MALGSFGAGRYATTYNANDIGITKGGVELQHDAELEDIAESDAYGLSVIDSIFRGGNCHIQFTSLEFKTGSKAAHWPFGGAVLGRVFTAAVPIGVLASAIAAPVVLTAVANTPSATDPATFTASLALLAKNSNLSFFFNSKLREVPVRLRLYPSLSSGTLTWYILT